MQKIEYPQMFETISHYDLMCIVTSELLQLTRRKFPSLSVDDLHEEQDRFSEFIYRAAIKKKSEKIDLTFRGRAIKVALLFVTALEQKSVEDWSNSIELNIASLNRFQIENMETVYLLAIGSLGTAIARDAAKEFHRRSDGEYTTTWTRSLRECSMIGRRTIIRISKIKLNPSEFEESYTLR